MMSTQRTMLVFAAVAAAVLAVTALAAHQFARRHAN